MVTPLMKGPTKAMTWKARNGIEVTQLTFSSGALVKVSRSSRAVSPAVDGSGSDDNDTRGAFGKKVPSPYRMNPPTDRSVG